MEIVKMFSIICLMVMYITLFLTQNFDVAQASALTAGMTNGVLGILTLNYAQKVRRYERIEKKEERI